MANWSPWQVETNEVPVHLPTKWNIPVACGSYAELLEDDSIDAIYIPLPNSLHREWSIRAMLAGKHVLCEKPLGLTEAECREMNAAADANGVTFMEAFMYRFHPRTETSTTVDSRRGHW